MKLITEVNKETIEELASVYLESKGAKDGKKVKLSPSAKVYIKPFTKLANFLCGTQVDPELYIDVCVHSKYTPSAMTSTKSFNKYSEYLEKMCRRTTNAFSDMSISLILVRRYMNDYNLSQSEYVNKSLGKLPLIVYHMDIGILHPHLLVLMDGFGYWYNRLPTDYSNEVKRFIEEIEYPPSHEVNKKIREMLNE